ncbi:hypothetical protein OG204_20605 [Streptomyces sp. NBC_01387]|uniref:hypothetical protein n=1 Tax=Streptomyces sp. NBC_01387 TaxID=2903849 RepID=UPI00324FCBA0
MSALSLRGPAWVTAREHRGTGWSFLIFLIVATGTVIALRTGAGDLPRTGGTGTPPADAQAPPWLTTVVAVVGGALLLLPMAAGAFMAGPAVGRTLERGSYQLLWTQSVTPVRWLVAQFVVPASALTAGSAVLIGCYRFGRARVIAEETDAFTWYDGAVFPTLGPVTVAYTLLALAVGALVGLLLRREVAAMAVTLAIAAGFLVVGARVRGLLWPGPNPSGTEHPASSHFWPLQLMETGIVLAIAALATAAAFQVLRRKHG